MPSREHELDYSDNPQSLRDPRRSSNLLVLVAVGAVAALVLVLVVGVVVTRLLSARSAQAEAVAVRQAAVAKAAAAANKLYTRDEFKAAVLAKSEQSVIDELGQPIKTVEDGEKKYLYYRNLTRNQQTGQVDGLIALEVVRGRVAAIDFNPPNR